MQKIMLKQQKKDEFPYLILLSFTHIYQFKYLSDQQQLFFLVIFGHFWTYNINDNIIYHIINNLNIKRIISSNHMLQSSFNDYFSFSFDESIGQLPYEFPNSFLGQPSDSFIASPAQDHSSQNETKHSDVYDLSRAPISRDLYSFSSNQTQGIKCDDDKKMDKKKQRSSLKNFLKPIKRSIIRLYNDELKDIKEHVVQKFLADPNKTNRKEFQCLFACKKTRKMFTQMFQDRKLERQIQLARITKGNLKLFINEIKLLYKSFVQGKLPNL